VWDITRDTKKCAQVLGIDEKVLLEMRASEWEKYIAPFEAQAQKPNRK
jgi:hypothetical protein